MFMLVEPGKLKAISVIFSYSIIGLWGLLFDLNLLFYPALQRSNELTLVQSLIM